jgi:hypothetical protein
MKNQLLLQILILILVSQYINATEDLKNCEKIINKNFDIVKLKLKYKQESQICIDE